MLEEVEPSGCHFHLCTTQLDRAADSNGGMVKGSETGGLGDGQGAVVARSDPNGLWLSHGNNGA